MATTAVSDGGSGDVSGPGSAVDGEIVVFNGTGGKTIEAADASQAAVMFNTYTDASNYERFAIHWTSNEARIQVDELGTGTQRDLALLHGGTRRFILGAAALTISHPIIAGVDNAYDIGSAAGAWKDIYLDGVLKVDGTQVVGSQQVHIADQNASGSLAGGDTVNQSGLETYLGSVASKINAVLAMIETHGLTASS